MSHTLRVLAIAVALLWTSVALNVRAGVDVAQDSTEKTVDQVFKNIKVLNGLPQSKLYPTMRFMAASLGFQCGDCHVIKNGFIDAPADDKPAKQTARQMIRLVIDINKTLGDRNQPV